MKINQFVCPACGHKWYEGGTFGSCDACGQYIELRKERRAPQPDEPELPARPPSGSWLAQASDAAHDD